MNARESAKAPIPRPALYEEVAERLRARIYAHELAPGSWLDEQTIATELGISRTPLREALKVLASEGLVRLEPRRGCYVAELTERDLDDIFPVMALLEGRCAWEAARRATSADFAELDAIHAELEKFAAANDADGFFDANQAFHASVQRIAGNRFLARMIEDARKVLKLTRRDSLRLDGRLKQSLSEHRDILSALRNRQENEAAQLMHAHLLSGRSALTRLREPNP